MFRWDFAKSAEAMFSRWAIKRICKFVLKKKLGDYILGDIDLDQLDVQLRQGTIQLTDLALNVDFLNVKLGGALLKVKEGSIASLSIKIPWKMQNCQIEVEELELVLSPCSGSNLTPNDETGVRSDDDKCTGSSSRKTEQGNGHSTSGSVALDVHEGVKTIAKIVKLILTSFHVRLKKLIVAFDPGSVVDEKRSKPNRTLVLRIAEIEYGTCVSENVTGVSDPKPESILGIAKLTNFVKFKDAMVEFLEINDTLNQPHTSSFLGRSHNEFYSDNSPSGCTSRVLSGATGGCSGILNLTIPWKNGCLDIHKLDADISIDPVTLSIEPSTILWFIAIWGSLMDVTESGSNIQHNATDSVYKYKSCSHSTAAGSFVPAKETVARNEGNFPSGLFSPRGQEPTSDALLPVANVIHNWVPLSINLEDYSDMDPDYGASIDQFFECFDGMRSSHASLSKSGIWNWTCSVFSAITAASSLASGCGHITSEQHNIETNLKATIAAFSVILSFHDEQKYSSQLFDDYQMMNDTQGTAYKSFSSVNMAKTSVNSSSTNSYFSQSYMNGVHSTEADSSRDDINYLNATCLDLSLVLQIFPQCTKFEAVVGHIKVDDHFYGGSETINNFLNCQNNNHGQTYTMYHIQSGVHGALPPLPFSVPESEDHLDASCNLKFHSVMQSVNGKLEGSQIKALSPVEPVKVTLFESFGECHGEYSVKTTNLNDKSTISTLFSLKLPPFILWMDFHLVNLLMNLFKQVGNSFGMSRGAESDVMDVNDDYKDGKNKKYTATTTISRGNLQGNIVIPNARMMLCFCPENNRDVHQLFCWDKFITLEFSPSSGFGKIWDGIPAPTANSQSHSYTASTSISLDSGNLDVYLVKAANENACGSLSELVVRPHFSANKIISVTSETDGHRSLLAMLWQKGPVTGPWVAMRALNLAESQDPRSRNKATGKGYEFASVTTAEDRAEANSHIRQEIVLSSSFLMHFHLSLVHATLMRHEYELLYILLKQMMDALCLESHNDSNTNIKDAPHAERKFGVQASVLVECDMLDLSITMDDIENISSSIQKELPGSWNNLRLNIEKFELLSVSDIGGICGANFFWLSHGEGELWGSIVDVNHKDSAKTGDFLLITCKNSMLRRGNGEGGNAISYGPAGTSITHLHNPQTLQGFTSVTVQCGTIIAPGCRLDWFNTITSFFTLPYHEGEVVDSRKQNETSDGDGDYKTSFFLDLVDVALSYEPQMMRPTVLDSQSADLSKASGQLYVGCILAAASLNLSNRTADNSVTNDHIIRLQDVGLLICQWSRCNSDRRYDADYLREYGYVKIAGDAHVASVVRTNCEEDLLWEVELSDLHIKLDTCSDTTLGLVHLLAQFQQLFAPDIQDALVHLQSRWSSTKQVHAVLDKSLLYENSDTDNENNHSAGLMDEVLDDYFYLQENQTAHSDSLDVESAVSDNRNTLRDEFNSRISHHPAVNNICSLNATPSESVLPCIGHGNSQNLCVDMPDFIESYYITELLPKTKLSVGKQSSVAACKRPDLEGEKGSWYRNNPLVFDENHIADTIDSFTEKQLYQKDESFSVSSLASDACKARGRIVLKNTDIRWRMFDGSDWPEATESSGSSSSPGRDENTCLELQFLGLDLQHDMYPDGEIFVSKLSLSIWDFHLHDNSKDAPWRMVLGYYHSRHHARESCSKALKLDLESVRPDPTIPLEEYRLNLALLPMRLHLDQSHLNFLINFFGGNSSSVESPDLQNDLDEQGTSRSTKDNIAEEALLPFFQKCDIRPVVVRVDYIPRNIDLAALRGGNYIELINLVPWKGIELQLKHVNSVGVYGWGGICESIVGEWLEDISKNQVRNVLKGLKPIQSLFSVTSGATKLVSLPIKNYRKDQRLIKGIQRGAITFLKSVTLEAVGLGVHLAGGAHDILLQTEYALASTASSIPSSGRSKSKTNVRSNQPKDAQQGMQQAYESLGDGISRTASALVGTPIKTYQRGQGAGSALVSVIRAVPGAAVTPASAAARAVHCALLGVRNSLDPEHMKDSMEKYLGSSQSQDHRL